MRGYPTVQIVARRSKVAKTRISWRHWIVGQTSGPKDRHRVRLTMAWGHLTLFHRETSSTRPNLRHGRNEAAKGPKQSYTSTKRLQRRKLEPHRPPRARARGGHKRDAYHSVLFRRVDQHLPTRTTVFAALPRGPHAPRRNRPPANTVVEREAPHSGSTPRPRTLRGWRGGRLRGPRHWPGLRIHNRGGREHHRLACDTSTQHRSRRPPLMRMLPEERRRSWR